MFAPKLPHIRYCLDSGLVPFRMVANQLWNIFCIVNLVIFIATNSIKINVNLNPRYITMHLNMQAYVWPGLWKSIISVHKNRHVFQPCCVITRVLVTLTRQNLHHTTAEIHVESFKALQNENMLFRIGDIIEYLIRCNLCRHGWFLQTWSHK